MNSLNETVDLITEEMLSDEQKLAINEVFEGSNLFIQGQAGTGKSTFIKYLQDHSTKNIVLCSPTAVAAINIGGTTLHSFFKLPIADFIDNASINRIDRRSIIKVVEKIDILIIDEISMVRPDILDAISTICKRIRCDKAPFGGIQTILIGDLYQLPPIIKKDTIDQFFKEYGTTEPYFFDSKSYKSGKFKKFEFTQCFRQNDKELLDNLLKIRKRTDLSTAIDYFNNCKIKDKEILDNAVMITPYKNIAEMVNLEKLAKLKGKVKKYTAHLSGTFEHASNESSYPAQKELTLKEGALVMFNKNDKNKMWINGSLGIVKKLKTNSIIVTLLSGTELEVTREQWETKEYKLKAELLENGIIDYQLKEKVTGVFKQFPLQLGYACTIHKAQGKTLDKVSIDLDRGAFAHGQLYVALSRTRNKEDINIVNNISYRDVIFKERIVEYLKTI